MKATPDQTTEAGEGNATSAIPPLVFLSHAGIDTEAARALKTRIEASPEAKECGLRVWFDKDDLRPGEQWQPQLEDIIQRRSTAFVVYLGSRGVVNWVDAEVRLGLSRAVVKSDYRFIPVVAAGSAGVEALPGFAAQYQGVSDVEHRADEFEKLMRAILSVGNSGSLRLEEEPFFGLQAIDEKRSHLFFGREEETNDLVQLLRRETLVMVTGDSGSGKSSLVRAGLVPAWRGGQLAIAKGEQPDDAIWHLVQMQPRSRPFSSLAEAVGEAARLLDVPLQDRGTLEDWVRSRDPDTVRRALRCDLPAEKTQVLLVVDQFEELVTIADSADRAPFVDLLLALADPADQRVRVVLTMRRDYYNLCSQFLELFGRLKDERRRVRYPVERMSDEGLGRVVTEPLRLAGILEGDRNALAATVLRDVGKRPGDLALVQMALTETWRRRQEHQGDLLQAYAAVGGVEGAIAKAAEDVYAQVLDENERRIAEPVFLRLVRLGDTAGATRRVARGAEFDDARWALVQKLASRDGKRLLLVGGNEGAETAEIAHEALVTQWPRYQTWLQAAAGDKRVLDQLIERAARFPLVASSSADMALRHKSLATGAELDAFVRLASQRTEWLSSLEMEFVKVSNAAAVRQRARERGLLVVAVVGGAFATIVAFFFVSQSNDLSLALADAHARLIWNNLQFTTPDLQPSEVDALWELVTSKPPDREAFLRAYKGTKALIATLAKRPDPVKRALGLTFTDMQAQVALDVVDAVKSTEVITQAETPQGRSRLRSDAETQATLRLILGVVKSTADPDLLAALAQAVKVMAGRISDEETQATLDLVLDAVEKTNDPDQLAFLAQAVQALAGNLTDRQAQVAFGRVLAAIKATKDPHLLAVLAQAVPALASKLTEAQAQAAFASLLDAINTTIDPNLLTVLAQAVQALAGKLTDTQARAAFGPLLNAIRTTTDANLLTVLAQTVRALADKFTDPQAQEALGPILDAINAANGPHLLTARAQAVEALAGKLTETQAQAAFDRLLDVVKTTTDAHQLTILAQAVQALTAKLSTEAKFVALPSARSGLAGARTGQEALAWAAALQALLPPQPTKEYVTAIIEALSYPTAALRVQDDAEYGGASPTDYLLGKLRDRFPEAKQLESGDLGAAVEWAAGPPFAIDLSIPLKRPPALSEVASSLATVPQSQP